MEQVRRYKELTEKNLVKFFEELHAPEPRQLVIHCGDGFKKMIDRKIQEEVYIRLLPILESTYLISSEECVNLESMIKSEDIENFYVAKSIIDNIQNHGNIISRT
jgi:hypothetical protein